MSTTNSSGETKQCSNSINIAQTVKRGDSTERSQVVPPFLIAGFTGDRSGSMEGLDIASAKGLFNWLKDTTDNAIKNSQSGKIFVTTFDHNSEKIIEGEDISSVYKKIQNEEIDIKFCKKAMKAGGTTKLFDTAITDLENIVMARDSLYESFQPALKKINPKIAMIWACCTDGFDNESIHNRREFREKVLWARDKGVKCFFLAANQEAQVIGQEYGFNPDTSLTFGTDAEKVECAMRSVTQCMREASSGSNNYVFTQLMRQSSGPSMTTPYNTPPDNNGFAMLRQRATNSAAATAISSASTVTPDIISQIGRS